MKGLSVILATLVTGCAVFPTSRTYYEPNPADGTPSRSQSCGYHRAAEDGLERKVRGLTISVFPRFDGDEKPLRVLFLVAKTGKSLSVDANEIELRIDGTTLRPTAIESHEPQPYFTESLDFIFPPAAAASDDIAVSFKPGFLKMDGAEVGLSPFQFRKVTKGDIYYASINC